MTLTITAEQAAELAKGEVSVEVPMEQPPKGYGDPVVGTLCVVFDNGNVLVGKNLPYPIDATVEVRYDEWDKHCPDPGVFCTATVTAVDVVKRDGVWVEVVTLRMEE